MCLRLLMWLFERRELCTGLRIGARVLRCLGGRRTPGRRRCKDARKGEHSYGNNTVVTIIVKRESKKSLTTVNLLVNYHWRKTSNG